MEIKGVIIQVLPLEKGEGKNGSWEKQDFILETEGTYPKKVCITAFGKVIESDNITEGNVVNVSINIESREYNGRWYTNVNAWKIEGSGELKKQAPTSTPAPADIPTDEEDDLPF